MEIHLNNDQFFRFESGQGIAIVNGVTEVIRDGSIVIVPRGTSHNFIAHTAMKFYTIYSPPHHPYDRFDQTRPMDD